MYVLCLCCDMCCVVCSVGLYILMSVQEMEILTSVLQIITRHKNRMCFCCDICCECVCVCGFIYFCCQCKRLRFSLQFCKE